VAIGEAAVEGATSVDYDAIPREITSAIVEGQEDVASAVEAIVTDIEQQFGQMAEETTTTTETMMHEVETTITDHAEPIHTATEHVRTNIEDEFSVLKSTLPPIMMAAMAGAYQALVVKENKLIARAQAIAAQVASIMASALKVNSPSRVMIDLFGHVMDGIYVGMDRGEDAVLKKAEDIAENLADALTLDPKTVSDMVCKMQAIVDTGLISHRGALAPAGAFAGGAGAPGPVYNISNTAYVTAPKAMSEYQITRELSDMSRRMQRQLK